jgi:hypothetical protein
LDDAAPVAANAGDVRAGRSLPTALPALIVLVVLGALFAGFAAARSARADTRMHAAAWGAITGPVWALAMTVLGLLAGGVNHGDADDGSVFGLFVFWGALLGAAGGALGTSPRLRMPG